MKTSLFLLIALMSSEAFARVGEIVKCSPRLQKISKTEECRQFSETSISIWNKIDSTINVETNNEIKSLNFPIKELSELLAFQMTTKIHEGFYNSETHDWVVYNYDTMYERRSVVLINENKMKHLDLVTEIFSSSNDIHKNTSFSGNTVFVRTDDRSKTIKFERDNSSVDELIAIGMDAYLKDLNLPNTNMFNLVKKFHAACGFEDKCLQKAYKSEEKLLAKEYKKAGNKDAVKYLKDYSPFGYPMHMYSELLEGCVGSPKTCGGMITENEKTFFRHNYNLDNGERALSYNVFMPGAFSILYHYVPVGSIVGEVLP